MQLARKPVYSVEVSKRDTLEKKMIDFFFPPLLCCENWTNVFHQLIKNTKTLQNTTLQHEGNCSLQSGAG